MPNPAALTKIQTKILIHAAGQPNRAVLPLPPECPLVGGARQKVLIALQSAGLVEESGRAADKRFLRISKLGLAAISTDAVDDAPEPSIPGGKLGILLTALSTPEGASISALGALTGWLPHTIRAALSRLRQRGYAVQLTEIKGQKRYRLTEAAHDDV